MTFEQLSLLTENQLAAMVRPGLGPNETLLTDISLNRAINSTATGVGCRWDIHSGWIWIDEHDGRLSLDDSVAIDICPKDGQLSPAAFQRLVQCVAQYIPMKPCQVLPQEYNAFHVLFGQVKSEKERLMLHYMCQQFVARPLL